MKRHTHLLWPLLVGALSLAAIGWLWSHERETQERHLRDNFDFGVRQTAARIEQRMTSYEQILRGARGFFEASDRVTREDFSTYVDALLAGADFAGLQAIAYAPLLSADRVEAHVAAQRAGGAPAYAIRPPGQRDRLAPVTYAAPVIGRSLSALGYDPFADPVRRLAMLHACDSGGIAISEGIRLVTRPDVELKSGFLMFMPLYAKGQAIDSVAARQDHLTGWVFAAFRIGDLMSSLYGEGTPGLDVRVYDGVHIDGATPMYPSVAEAAPSRPARFEAQEYIGFAGHTWTLRVRSKPEFEQRYSNHSDQIIAIAGAGLCVLLALLTWQLVTGRERAHGAARAMTRQLRDSAERYRRIVDTADEGIWTVDSEGRTSFVNPKMQQMLGCSADEMLGRRWVDFTDEGDRADPGAEETAPLPRDLAEQRDIRFRRKDGSVLWATLSTGPILDASGQRAGVLAMVTDVTERRADEARRAALEGQLRQSQKMEAIGTLAGGIAHDFNNILAAILGNVALVKQDLGPGHSSMDRLEQIVKAGARARSLVQQIVAFSRQQPQELLAQPLRPLLEEAVTLLRSTLPAQVQLDLRLSDAPLHAGVDATQLQQVMMNLCTNAWYALQGRSGRIVIGLDAIELDADSAARLGGLTAGPHAHVWVSDTGSGMDEATRLRAFEPFFTTKPVGQGTGLGLPMVHGIVSAHHGAIAVTSTAGRGSSFDMYFPLAAPTTAPAPAPAIEPQAVPGRGQHVLYVDDDPVMVLMVESLLQRSGYRVTCVADARHALALVAARAAAFDVVVTDFNMPELSGLDLAFELDRVRPSLPVVITSGYVSETMRADALRAGVRHVLQKEYTLEQLGEVLQRTLSEPPGVAASAVPPAPDA